MESVDKRFGATRALQDVSFSVRAGAVHAFLGGNGSGKSTLIKILAGVERADSGTIEVHGVRHDASAASPKWARALGMRFVHQELGVFPSMSVAENIALSSGYRHRLRVPLIRRAATQREAQEHLDRFNVRVRASEMMSDLRPADRTMVAIARALGDDESDVPLTLVLDEPTSALPEREVQSLLGWLRDFAQTGITSLFVTHRLDEVAYATDVTVLRDAIHRRTAPVADVPRAELVDLITGGVEELGRSEAAASPESRTQETPRLRVESLNSGILRSINLEAYDGEVVGIAGLLGSGRSRLLRSIGGVQRPDSGTIYVAGQKRNAANQLAAIRSGIVYVPESRTEGIFASLSVAENLTASFLALRRPLSYFSPREARREARAGVTKYGVKTASVSSEITTLSGGNQQKVLIGRWLRDAPQILLLDEPSVGVDIGARQTLHQLIRTHVQTGATAVCVSSDFDELATLCDRVLVLRNGTVAEEIRGANLSPRFISQAVHRVDGDAVTTGTIQ
ncbi:MAG: sugar ABC transporter ATP-binding protein [Nocardioidaceae bacterium]